MMKQIILVSRIHYYDNQEEFAKYSDGDSNIIKESNTFRLLIIKGSTLRNLDTNSQKAAAIASASNIVLDKSAETLIAYHFHNDLNKAIRLTFKRDGWNDIAVKGYGTEGDEASQPIYQILNRLGEAIRADQENEQPQLIERLWRFISHDPILEAKLLLLQAILRGGEVLSTVLAILNDSDREKGKRICEAAFKADPMPAAVIEVLDNVLKDLETQSVTFEEILTTDVFSPEYQHAFENFRDALGLE